MSSAITGWIDWEDKTPRRTKKNLKQVMTQPNQLNTFELVLFGIILQSHYKSEK